MSSSEQAKSSKDISWEEVNAFHLGIRDCFSRREAWEGFLYQLREQMGQAGPGIISPAEPEQPEPPAPSPRSRQWFLSQAAWDDALVLTRFHELIRDTLGDRNGVLVFLEKGFASRGTAAAGAAKQVMSPAGRVGNGQVWIFAVYVSRRGAAVVDMRMYIPREWFADDYHEQRQACRFPVPFNYATKSEIVLTMLERIRSAAVLPFRFGQAALWEDVSRDFMDRLAKIKDVHYFHRLPQDAMIWVTKKIIWERRPLKWWLWHWHKKKVRTRKIKRIPVRPWAFIRNLGARLWQQRPLPGGDVANSRPLGSALFCHSGLDPESSNNLEILDSDFCRNDGREAETELSKALNSAPDAFVRRRVPMSFGKNPPQVLWIMARRNTDKRPVYAYYVSNAMAHTRLEVFTGLIQAGEAAQTCLGEIIATNRLIRCRGRTWTGLHRHFLIAMLARHFVCTR